MMQVATGVPLDMSEAEIEQLVQEADLPVVVDCWATWCPPCRVIAPILDDLARTYANKLTITKLNVDEAPRYASKYGIYGAPTLLLFKGGREVGRLIGAQRRSQYETQFEALIADS